jgi:acylglycerol lipase
MKHIEGDFTGVGNLTIHHQAWLPEQDAKAVLFIVHGLGEHSGRYGNVVSHFVPLGYAAYALDHIGHGKSGGARECVECFAEYTDMLTLYSGMVRAWQPGKPIFLLGHSMGGLIAAHYLIDHPEKFRGAVISAPAVKVIGSVSPLTIAAGKVPAKIAPQAGLLPVDPHGISRDPDVVNAYINDPLVFHAKTSARLAAELLKAIQRVASETEKITLPFITLQGTEDRIVHPGGAQMLYDRAASKDKTIKIYKGLYHEVFNEPEHPQVLKDVETWLEARA